MNITVTGVASPAGWQHTINQYVQLPPSHVIKFSISGNSWGICVKSDGTDHWLIGLDASGNPTVEKYIGGVYSQAAARPDTFSGAMDVLVQFSEIRFGSNDDVWNTVSMWINGFHAISYFSLQGVAFSSALKFGLAVRASGTKTFSNLVIPQLGMMAEVATIDTGESPAGGLQRTIEGRNLKYQVRSNGQLHAWKPDPVDAVAVLEDWDNRSETVREEIIRTHIRMVGAYDFAEYTNDSLIAQYGYSFDEVNNPYLMSEQDDYNEAKNTVRRLLETAINGSVGYDAIHFLEVDDGIVLDGDKRIINGFTLIYKGAQVEHNIDYRGDRWNAF